MSTVLSFIDDTRGEPLLVRANGFPPAGHPSEADLFSRQVAMPGHNQQLLESAHIGVVGCGGLGSWIALGLVRMGVRRLTLLDGDRYDRSNAPRQLMFPRDEGVSKAHSLARNLKAHATNSAVIAALPDNFGESSMQRAQFDCLVVGVDNNRTRLLASRLGLRHATPVVFAMLSRDGLRAQVFLQHRAGPCLSCVLPNLEASSAAPCAAAAISTCFLAAAHAIELVSNAATGIHRAPNWRETSLDGTRDTAARPSGRRNCTCSRAMASGD